MNRAPRICRCGLKVAHGATCICQRRRQTERNARHDAKRPSARQRGYDTKWDKARAQYLAANPRCCRCSAPAEVVDHIIPHKGDKKLFWSRSNWQPLCRSCHSRSKQSQERREGVVGDFSNDAGIGGGKEKRDTPGFGVSGQ